MLPSWRSGKVVTIFFTRRRGIYTDRMSRSYGDAVSALNMLQSNFAIVDKIRKSGRGMNKEAIPEMIEWCRKIGYEVCAFTDNLLGIIHLPLTAIRLQPVEHYPHRRNKRQGLHKRIHLLDIGPIPAFAVSTKAIAT